MTTRSTWATRARGAVGAHGGLGALAGGKNVVDRKGAGSTKEAKQERQEGVAYEGHREGVYEGAGGGGVQEEEEVASVDM